MTHPRMKRAEWRRVWNVALVLAAVGLPLAGCNKAESSAKAQEPSSKAKAGPPTVGVVTPEPAAGGDVILGTVVPSREMTVTPQATGRIKKIHAKLGDWVKAGKPLVTLDPTDANLGMYRAGASVGALLAILAGASTLILQSCAFGGALLSTLLVFSLAHGQGNWDTTRLLLTGVVLAAGWGALISLVLAISPGSQIQGMLFWLLGDLSFAPAPVAGGLVLIALAPAAFLISPSLNLLVRGELQAASLGVAVGKLRVSIYVFASLATATAVTQAGNIGFIGLIAPHMLRLAGARDHRVLIPGVILLGGTLLLFADALSRLVIAPRQLPVGVLTALLGVPLFLYLLYRSRGIHNA